jgi:hypothetical protein
MATPNHTRRPSPIKDLSKQVFGRLTVISLAEKKEGQKAPHWFCLCECGESRVICGTSLVRGLTRSCGCLQRESSAKTGKLNSRHGLSKTQEYASWNAMIQRCYNSKLDCWDRYGGRGITVCERWRNSFEAFLADMGTRPSPRHSIERDDTDGNYEPGNCRWATCKEQQRNRSTNLVLEFRGVVHTAVEWSEILGIKHSTLRARIRKGWSAERALATTFDARRKDSSCATDEIANS